MTVQEFINRYNNYKDESARDKFVNERLKTKYIPFIDKCNICERITKSSYLNQNGDFEAHTSLNFILYILSLIDTYTDIDICFVDSDGNVKTDKEYDLLKKNNVLEQLINIIPESEAKEFQLFIENSNSDLYSTVCNARNVVSEFLNKTLDILNYCLYELSNSQLKDNGDEKKISSN